MRTLIALFAFTVVFTQTALARNWDRVEIPGAVCGDGLPYTVYVNKKPNTKNLLVEFMGGGACWSFQTCYGKGIRTWMHPIIELPFYSFLTSDIKHVSDHPFFNDSAIYFPYCTGDVFSADHVANYDGVPANHQGYRNIVLAFQFLNQQNILDFSNTERLTVWGASAGAIGALVHLKNIEPYFPRAKKIAIIDSAGLHFGPTFWNKFTPQLLNDFTVAFGRIGLALNPNDGFVAKDMGPVLANLQQWTVGFLQSTRDVVMSIGFGEISQENHRKLVLSNQGIAAVAKPYANTSVWITDSATHTFLLQPESLFEKDMSTGQTSLNFVNELVLKATNAE